ncbi:Eco57I restriction-modification methylase domain-containing protein [Sphingomonas sp. PB4P5]|uniref:Eco57I restriction-modification methylase domain-containing protein n=1 Tax=Parasphingomonas puruogangriensis TaxID=3096155 RepID=UPI002FC7B9BC
MRLLSLISEDHVDIGVLLNEGFVNTKVAGDLAAYISLKKLGSLSRMDKVTAYNLIRDFYSPKEAPYDLNFALMSKHALSRIYERFVSLLVPDDVDSAQLSFIAGVPSERTPIRTGAVYTPQFVASFFARYIRENTTPRRFRSLTSFDPACGSGIFLRNLLELQCSPLDPNLTKATISDLFGRSVGYDRDANASEATRLSLALLHLVATDRLPTNLAIYAEDVIATAQAGGLVANQFGAVMTNPPYIKLDHLSAADRSIHSDYLGDQFKGRLDTYISFVKLCLEVTEPGGLACFVLPQTFLTARNSELFRREISKKFDVKCLIDLSAINVFDGVGAYSILLVIQRRLAGEGPAGSAIIAQASDFVGAALQAVLDGQLVNDPYYKVFEVSQAFFAGKTWVIIGPDAMVLDQKLNVLPKLGEYLDIFQGFVTGADDVFIIPKMDVADGEIEIFLDYMPDRQIGRFSLPARSVEVVFYPYLGLRPITEDELQRKFPKTWQYLVANRPKLEKRKRSPGTPWWKPERPREPTRMRSPKIICPHLMLTPRFAVDARGRFATSHGPVMIAKDSGEGQTLLYFFCGILNSIVSSWYLRTYVPTYSKGYSRLEPATLKNLPVPDFRLIDPVKLERFLQLVKQSNKDLSVEDEIDELVIEFYGLGPSERRALGRSL